MESYNALWEALLEMREKKHVVCEELREVEVLHVLGRRLDKRLERCKVELEI